MSQRKLAMSEYTEVTDKLSELRQQKQKLSRTVRDKEEVIKEDTTILKINDITLFEPLQSLSVALVKT